MFFLKDLDSAEKPADGDRKVADFIIAPEREGQSIQAQHKVKGIYTYQDESGGIKECEIGPGDRFTFFPYMGEITRQIHRILVSGRSGSGKSWIIGMLLDQMAHSFPGHDIVIISFVAEDPSLDRPRNGKKPLRLNLKDPDMFNIEPSFFEKSIVIYDDIEKGTDKATVKYLLNLRAMMMETSRHYNTHIITVSHDLLGGNTNKTVKSEATSAFLFVQYNQPHQTREYLRKYVGLSNEQINEIMQLPSRWCYINLLAPTFYITDRRVKLLI